jgi:prolyl 4-hydroxylase
MSKRILDPSWTKWLDENLRRNCPAEELLGILLQHDFTVDSIKCAMGERFPGSSPLLGRDATQIDYVALAALSITGGRQFPSDRLQLFVIDEFLSPEICDAVVAISDRHLRPSTVTTGNRDPGYRTSSTCDLGLVPEPLVKQVDERIARAMGIRPTYSEGIQAQRYEVGQQFKAHTDFFSPGTEEYSAYAAKNGGNRTWTFMVYLANVERGGGTRFFSIDHTFLPKKGQAVVWNNLNSDGTVNPATVHAGLPVEAGRKIVITKWFREIGSGPMFYQTGDRARAQSLHSA